VAAPGVSASPAAAQRAGAGRLILRHLGQCKGRLAAGALLSFAGGLGALAEPLVAGAIIGALGRGQPLTGLVVLLVALALSGAALVGMGAYVLQRTAESMARAARERLVSRILLLRVREMDRLRPGDLIARVTADASLLRDAIQHVMVDLGTNLLLVIGSVGLLFWLDPLLLGISLAALAVSTGIEAVMMPRIRRAWQEAQQAVGDLGSVMERALGAFRTIKACGTEGRESADADASVTEAWRSGVRVARCVAISKMAGSAAVQLAVLAVLGFGGARVATGELSMSSFISFLFLLLYLTTPLTQLISGITELQGGLAAIRRIHDIERLEVEERGVAWGVTSTPDCSAPSSPMAASVGFELVSFRYDDEAPLVLRGVSLEIPARGVTAIVGPSGAGKSTLFGLIERFYDPVSGRILLDGQDLRDWPLNALRQAIAYVEQDATVLAGTLRDNLLYGAPAASDADLREALDLTRLTEFVGNSPGGLRTPVGHRGVALSGGQRQRVAIARALLRRPRLLLLDEATAHLDAENEAALRATIADIARSTTIVVIAHRLSTVVDADRIIVLESGQVHAIGTDAELRASSHLYRALAGISSAWSPAPETLRQAAP
jgi:ABC-type multidrug transport system fused ATPase/permease subunit